jgi:hypothetical protein
MDIPPVQQFAWANNAAKGFNITALDHGILPWNRLGLSYTEHDIYRHWRNR